MREGKKSIRLKIFCRTLSVAKSTLQQTTFCCLRSYPHQNQNHVHQSWLSSSPWGFSEFHGNYLCWSSDVPSRKRHNNLWEKYSHNGKCFQRSTSWTHRLQIVSNNSWNRCLSLQLTRYSSSRRHRDAIKRWDKRFTEKHFLPWTSHERQKITVILR